MASLSFSIAQLMTKILLADLGCFLLERWLKTKWHELTA